MSRILVTGATGFIGRSAVPLLLEAGHEVHALGRSRPDAPVAAHHAVDLLDADAVRRVVGAAGASHLLHLAWDAEPGAYWRSPANLDWVSASLVLLRAFRDAGGVRAVSAGTCAEYAWAATGWTRSRRPAGRRRCTAPRRTASGGSRRATPRRRACSFATGRVFFLYGPGEKRGRLVADAARALLAGEPFPTSHGRQRRDFLHVRDVAGAFVALLGSSVSGPVNIGSGAAVPVRSLIEAVAAVAGGGEAIAFGARQLAPSEPDVVEAAPGRLFDEVGFRPRIALADGIAETVRWWRDRSVS